MERSSNGGLVPSTPGRATGRSQYRCNPSGLPPSAPTQWSQQRPGLSAVISENAASGQGERPVTIRQSDIHLTIQRMMAGYVTHFRSVQLKSLLKTAQLSEADLPTIAKYVVNGKNGLCYAYVLGKCQGRMCGKFPKGHAPVADISDAFATELCGKLATAVAHRMATEPPMTQAQYVGSPSHKQFKRTA